LLLCVGLMWAKKAPKELTQGVLESVRSELAGKPQTFYTVRFADYTYVLRDDGRPQLDLVENTDVLVDLSNANMFFHIVKIQTPGRRKHLMYLDHIVKH